MTIYQNIHNTPILYKDQQKTYYKCLYNRKQNGMENYSFTWLFQPSHFHTFIQKVSAIMSFLSTYTTHLSIVLEMLSNLLTEVRMFLYNNPISWRIRRRDSAVQIIRMREDGHSCLLSKWWVWEWLSGIEVSWSSIVSIDDESELVMLCDTDNITLNPLLFTYVCLILWPFSGIWVVSSIHLQ